MSIGFKKLVLSALDYGYDIVRNNASLPILLGLLNGILPLVLTSEPVIISTLYSIPMILLFLPSLWHRHKGKTKVIFRIFPKIVLFTIIGWLSILNWFERPANHYSKIITKQNCGGIIEAEIIDTSCVGEELAWLGNPRIIYARLLRLRFSEYDEWHTVTGKIMIKAKGIPILKYGDVVKAKGVFVVPNVGSYSGKSFYNYLRARGVYKIFEADSAQIINHISSIVSHACNFRDLVMSHVISGLSIRTKKIVAAIFFGCKQGIGKSIKNSFLMSGTLHAFAISGLHIGILSTLTLMTLIFLPLRIRYAVLPIVLILYVITVGMRVSAIRALLMISIWAIHRTLFYKTSSVNIIFFTACCVLVVSPYSVVDVGFQYSFITVLFLIVSCEFIQRWVSVLEEEYAWKPKSYISRWQHLKRVFRRRCFESFSFCSVAWVASSVLMALYNGFYILTSVFVNIIIIPLLMVLFFAVTVKIFLPTALSFIGVALIEFSVDSLLNICQIGSVYSSVAYIGGVSLIVITIYYFSILFGVATKDLFKSITAVVIATIVVFVVHNQFLRESVEIFLFKGGKQPVFVIIDNNVDSASIINCGSFDTAMEVLGVLKSKGIHKINEIVLAGGSIDYYKGADYLCYKTKVDKVYVKSGYMRSRTAKFVLNNFRKNGAKVVEGLNVSGVNGGVIDVFNNKNGYKVTCCGMEFQVITDNDGVVSVKVIGNGVRFSQSYELSLVHEIVSLRSPFKLSKI